MIPKRLPSCLAPALAAGCWAAPAIANACAVCTAGRDDETRFAFILTTVFLSVLPLALIGGIAWWVRRRVRASERTRADRPIPIAPQRPAAG